jgi:hypothetical protein
MCTHTFYSNRISNKDIIQNDIDEINQEALNFVNIYIYIFKGVDVVEWSSALDVRLSEWCCSVSMVWVQIPSREEQKVDSSKI